MHAGAAYRRALQLHRVEHCNRVHKPCAGGVPLYFTQCGFCHFVRPFERNGILREFRGTPKAFAIRYAVKRQHKPVGRNIISCDVFPKPFHSLCNSSGCHQPLFNCLKAQLFQPDHIFRFAVGKRPAFRTDKCKGIKAHVSPCGNFTIQLAHCSAAKVTGIFIFFIIVQRIIDATELAVWNHTFAAQNKFAGKGDCKRDILEHACVVGHVLTDFAVAACNGLLQYAAAVFQHDSQPVQFPGKYPCFIAQKAFQLTRFLCFVQRKNRAFVPYLFQIAQHGKTDFLRGAAGKNCPGSFF